MRSPRAPHGTGVITLNVHLTFHYTLAITMRADYKYQSLSFPYTHAAPQHSAVKTQHSSSFWHAAHADKTTEGKLFVTLQGANSVW